MGFRIEVTEEQNRAWHRDNLREAHEWVERVQAESARRLELARVDLREAIDWAAKEGFSEDEIDAAIRPVAEPEGER